ncbi:uncharacterized protein J3R85_013399 [Psidium guajava]|nr:uncharacterized protein J3R85_013399 [Psidium guajava]
MACSPWSDQVGQFCVLAGTKLQREIAKEIHEGPPFFFCQNNLSFISSRYKRKTSQINYKPKQIPNNLKIKQTLDNKRNYHNKVVGHMPKKYIYDFFTPKSKVVP